MESLMVSGVLKPVFGTLASIAADKFAISWGVKSELESMASMLSAVQAVLQEAEEKQWKNPSVKDWLAKLKDVAFVADDVIDEFATEAAIWKIRSERGGRLKASKYFLLPKRLAFRLNFGEKIREVNRRLAEIEKEKNSFELTPREEVAVPESRMTTSAAVTSKLYGQDDDKKKVIDVLLKNFYKKDEDLLIYAIYGMGGLGKTTLANTVFHDFIVSELFKLKIWICVSDNFDIPRLIRAILESIDGHPRSPQETESLQLELKKKLSGKEFLLILDDVWNEDQMKWEEFNNILSCGAKGSAVIFTTRMEKIALLMAPTYYAHRLSNLSEDDSWSLFEQRAIGGRKREEYMERIGEAVLIKCCGVPLAIIALGGLMRSKNGEVEWRSVMESGIWEQGQQTVLSALGVSFYHLSPQLRQCFTFCAVFPKDYELERDDLIQLWMANGFIPSESRTKWYDLGIRVFNELVSRGFIQDVEADKRGSTSCKIHDLMHDLALSIMGDECLILNDENGTELQVSMKLRHLFLQTESTPVSQVVMSTKFHSLRSFLQGRTWPPPQMTVESKFLLRLKHIRVLKASVASVEDDRSLVQISRLTHLRYLDLSQSEIKALPESIIYLQNLQSLNLSYCKVLLKLPRNLRYIKSLRFLDIRGCGHLENMPDMEQLKSQQIRVDGLIMKLDNNDCQISDLRDINVSTELFLRQFESVRNPQDAREADLKSKSGLRFLRLQYSETDECNENDVVDRVIDALQPPPNLKRLWIESFPGSKLPVWLGYLPNLVTLFLHGSKRCEYLPPLEKLPFLEFLSIRSMPLVKYFVGTETRSYNNNQRADLFPALETLSLEDMPSLVAWTKNNGNDIFPTQLVMFKSLEELDVKSCVNLVSPLPIAIGKGSEGGAMKGSGGTSSSLERLGVDSYRQLVSFSKGLTALKCLDLEGFLDKDTPWEGLQHLSSVSTLVIGNCKRLTSLPEFLTTFNSISALHILDCPNLTSLSENSRCFSALSSLLIHNCEKLSALPDCLDTLEDFDVDNCPNLTSLDYGLLNNNTSLEKFIVTGCPELEKRCRSEGTGGYWPHIANIPDIKIGDCWL